MLQYRRKLERGELAPVLPAASVLFLGSLTSAASTVVKFISPVFSSAEGTGDSSDVLHSDGEDVQHHPHPRH